MYIRHQGFEGWIRDQETNDLYMADTTFIVRPSNIGNPDAISLESVNYPGHFLRHANWHIFLHNFEPVGLFRLDSSFFPVDAVSGNTNAVSFKSVNYPTHFISHGGFRLRITDNLAN